MNFYLSCLNTVYDVIIKIIIILFQVHSVVFVWNVLFWFYTSSKAIYGNIKWFKVIVERNDLTESSKWYGCDGGRIKTWPVLINRPWINI